LHSGLLEHFWIIRVAETIGNLAKQRKSKGLTRGATSNNTLPDTVPIAAYRQGDFSSLITTENRLVTTASGPYVDPLGRTIPSGTIFDPTNTMTVNGVVVRNPFPNNQIPPSRFDPVAVKILALIPQPLGPNAGQAGANYLAPFDQSRVSSIPP